jgi:GLPGLI family protein
MYKATCKWFGNDYIAWYAPDIAVPFGPNIFYGLPGLY